MNIPSLARASALLLAAFSGASVNAATLYWNGVYTAGSPATYGSWQTVSNWTTDAAATTPSAAVPTLSDDVVFNTTPLNSSVNQTGISVDVAARSLTFNSTGTMRLSQSNSTRILSLGSGGLTMNSGAGGVTIGESTGSLFTEATSSQTWADNSTASLTVRRLRVSNSAAGDVTVTLAANSSGSITFNNSIGDSADGTKKLSLAIDSAGSGTVTLLAAGTASTGGSWTGGTTVKRGVLLAGTATVGVGDVKLGDTSGSGSATLRLSSATAFTTNLIAQAGNTGVNTLELTATSSSTYAGNIALNGDLTVGVRNVTGGSFITGVISGSGNLIKGQYQGSNTTGMLTLGGVNTFSGNTAINVGSFTLADDAALTFYIGNNGVSNKVSGAGTNAATFAGDFILNLTGASLVDGNSWQLVDVGTLNESFAGTFLVRGFTETNNVWSNGAGFTFTESTGMLSYASTIPEPSSVALLGGIAALGLGALRRRRRAA